MSEVPLYMGTSLERNCLLLGPYQGDAQGPVLVLEGTAFSYHSSGEAFAIKFDGKGIGG